MQREVLRDRFLGTITGLAIGEALGAQFEGRSATDIQMSLGNAPTKMEGGGRYKLKPGENTDDAQQVILMMDSLNTMDNFDGPDIALRLVNWATTRPKGLGPHSEEILNRLKRKLDDWTEPAHRVWYRSSGTAAGNGAFARALVVGLFYWNDIDEMVENTIRACQITHWDPRTIESALVLNFLLVQCLHQRFSPDLYHQAIMFLEATRRSPKFEKMVLDVDFEKLHEYSNFTPYAPYDTEPEVVLTALKRVPNMQLMDLRTTGFSVHTMQLAVWILFNSRNFQDAISRAVRLGGDSDTQGAVVGALMGARVGLAQIPGYWRAPLISHADITRKAEVLLDRSLEAEEKQFQEGKRAPTKEPPRVL
ncbi:MAG: ADP-ribosylglycohydrolase family protein [Sumerlaeia bacterium]